MTQKTICADCNSELNYRTGEKNNRKWAGLFCPNKECKYVKWLPSPSDDPGGTERDPVTKQPVNPNFDIEDALRKVYAKLLEIERLITAQPFKNPDEVSIDDIPA